MRRVRASPSSGRRPQRVLYVTAALPPAKVPEADHAVRQCLKLADRGFEVHVLTTGGPWTDLPASVRVHAAMPGWYWSALPTLWGVLRRVQPDVVLLYFLGTLFAYSTMVLFLPLLVRLALPRTRTVTQFSNIGHGAPNDKRFSSKLKRALFKALGPFRLGALLTGSSAIVLLSEHARDRLAQFSGSAPAIRKSVVIPPGPLLRVAPDARAARELARCRLGLAEGDFVVGFFGRLAPGKGIEALIRAVGRLREERPNLRCLLIGGFLSSDYFWNAARDYGSQLRDLIAELALEDVVVCTGEYDWESLAASQYLYACDALMMALSSGVHLNNSSFAAACRHELPVVVSVGSFPDPALEDERNVLVLPDATPEQMARSIARLMDDAALRNTLRDGARRLAEAHFDWDVLTDRLAGALGPGGGSARLAVRHEP